MLIDKANSFIGKPFGDFTPFDRQANEQDQLYSIGQNVGTKLWGEDITQWTPEQVQELTDAVHQAQYGDGEETWLSETIRAEFGREGAARAGMSLLIPGGVVTRQSFRDEQIKLAGQHWEDFYAGKPTTKLGESAATGRQMATSANPVWVALNNEYYKIGTKEQQGQYGLFNDLLYNPDELNPKASIVVVNGDGSYTYYTMAQLAALSDDDRRTVVQAWAANTQGMQEAVETVKTGRDAFKAEHPDYADYSVYQKGVNDYPGGISQFRKDMADNANFKAAEDAERKRLKDEGKSGAVLEAELDQWATGQHAFFAANNEKWKNADQISSSIGPSSVAAMGRLIPEEAQEASGGSTGKEPPKDPTVDDYWGPEKGIARLTDDQAQFDHDNSKMEADFGDAWNQGLAEWEDHADSAKERDELGIGDQTYVTPSVSETMRRYEDWEEDHPGGTPEEFFAVMLQTQGFGKKTAPGGAKTTSLPAGGVTYKPRQLAIATSANGTTRQLGYATKAPAIGSRPAESEAGKAVVNVAETYIGQVPYVWGGIPGKGQDPSGGWDCSGMTYWLDQNYGSGQLPMGSHYQYQYAVDTGKLFTDLTRLEPGDIVFIDTGWQGGAGGNLNPSGHVGIYAGNGQLINAANESNGTVIVPLNSYGGILGAMHGDWNG
jgi:cell wall-associated NlpC family hydrolase